MLTLISHANNKETDQIMTLQQKECLEHNERVVELVRLWISSDTQSKWGSKASPNLAPSTHPKVAAAPSSSAPAAAPAAAADSAIPLAASLRLAREQSPQRAAEELLASWKEKISPITVVFNLL